MTLGISPANWRDLYTERSWWRRMLARWRR